MVAHYGSESFKDFVTSAMAGVELCLGIGIRQPVGKFWKLVIALMIVEQMESSHNVIHREWTCCKYVLQAAMSTSSKQQPASI